MDCCYCWLLIASAIILLIVYLANKFGLFNKFEMNPGTLLSCNVVYLPHKGQYSNIGPLFQQIDKDAATTFKLSNNFGFYLDNPEITEPSKCRAVAGILVNNGEQFKIRQFLSKHPTYQHSRLRSTKYLSYEMPFINIFSILLMVKTVYPKIHNYIKKQELDQSQMCGMMEVYKCLTSNRTIQIILPLENQRQFTQLYLEKFDKSNSNQDREVSKKSESGSEKQFERKNSRKNSNRIVEQYNEEVREEPLREQQGDQQFSSLIKED